jgi:hypothetical protein
MNEYIVGGPEYALEKFDGIRYDLLAELAAISNPLL